jgi:hypothetical protein
MQAYTDLKMLAETNDVEGDAVMQDAHEDGV